MCVVGIEPGLLEGGLTTKQLCSPSDMFKLERAGEMRDFQKKVKLWS